MKLIYTSSLPTLGGKQTNSVFKLSCNICITYYDVSIDRS